VCVLSVCIIYVNDIYYYYYEYYYGYVYVVCVGLLFVYII